MEEAGQDVPSWLRGEAERFEKHQVQGCLEGVCQAMCQCTFAFVSVVYMMMSMFPLRLDRGRKVEEEMQEVVVVEGPVAVDASSVGKR